MTVQPDIHHRSHLPYCVPPRHCYWFRNFNRISIDYAFRPRLRYRLTLSRLTLLRKPYVYGARGSHPRYRYLCRQSLFRSLQRSFRSRFTATECSPTITKIRRPPQSETSVRGLSPVILSAQGCLTSELLRFL